MKIEKETAHQSSVQLVEEFHNAFGLPCQRTPAVQEQPEVLDKIRMHGEFLAEMARVMNAQAAEHGGSELLLRMQLITEELSELAEAMADQDVVESLDALTDLQYVLDGTYLTLGLDRVKDRAFAEVHASNMSKLGEDGKPLLEESGRVMKGPNFFRPDLKRVLEK